MNRLIPKSRIYGKKKPIDSVGNRIKEKGAKSNMDLLNYSQSCWDSLSDVRATRSRNIRYVYADQWGDLVKVGNKYVKERERIAKRTGGIVLQNNHLFKIVNSIVGVYVKSETMPVCFARTQDASKKSQMMTDALQTNYDVNSEKDILTSELIEMICGGMPICVEEWATHDGEPNSYTYAVNPDYFFYNSKANDPRMWDIDLIGEIRDYSLPELAAEIAESDYDYEQLKQIYQPSTFNHINHGMQSERYDNSSWSIPPEENLCRTYRIWTYEHKQRVRCYDPLDESEPLFKIELEDLPSIIAKNDERIAQGLAAGMTEDEIPLIDYGQYDDGQQKQGAKLGKFIDQYWHFQMLTPQGLILVEYDSPYEHGSHPYIFVPHHYVNGKIFPFISVIIDQQRYINRLISLHDLAIQNAAKGLKMIPKNMIGDLSPEQFAKKSMEIGDFLFYEPDPKFPNLKPEVFTTNATNIGTSELLRLQIDFINDISSVSNSLQGKQPSSGTSAARYAMEMQNSTTSISSIFARFTTFETQLAKKKMKVIHQYWNTPRCISQKHANGYASYSQYEPQAVQDIDFDIRISQSPETPIAKMMLADAVDQLWQSGVLTAKQKIKYLGLPGTEDILLDIEENEKAAQQGQALSGISPEAQQGLPPADEGAVQQVKDALMS